MQKADRAYLFGGAGVLLSRGLSMVAGVASLWILSHVLTTEQFAGYSVAMSVVFLTGLSAGFGLERTMVLKIAEMPPQAGMLRGRSMMTRIAAIVLALSCAAMMLVLALATTAAPSWHSTFIAWLVPIIPATALSFVLISWFQANHVVGVSQSMFGAVDIVRCGLFALCFVLGAAAGWIAVAAILAALVPILILSGWARGRTEDQPDAVGLKDAKDGLLFFVMRLATMGFEHFDIFIMGLLGTPQGTAQYVVATRFGALVQTAQVVFAPTFAPRVRRHLALGDMELADREYHVARVIGFAVALALGIVFLLGGQVLLGLFGEIGGGFRPFVMIVAVYTLSVGVGMHSVFLSMANNLPLATANRSGAALVFLLLLTVLIPRMDAMGAAWALFLASAMHDATGIALLKRRTGISALDLRGLALTGSTVATMVWVAAFQGDVIVGAGILAVLFFTTVVLEWILIRAVIRNVLDAICRRTG